MIYAILCYIDEAELDAWSTTRDEAVLARRALAQQRIAAEGRLGLVARLMPTSTAVTVRAGRETIVLDGPFADTKEQLLGFFVIECESLQQAIDATRDLGDVGAFEIRPLRALEPGTLRSRDLAVRHGGWAG